MTTYPPTASTSLPLTLPGDPTWGTLHELSEQRLDHPAAVSLYVALDDGGPRTPRELLQHEGSLVGELRKLARLAEPQAPGHDARMALRSLADRIAHHLHDRRPAGRHVHGIACFVTPTGDIRTMELPESPGDSVALERTYQLVPLTSLVPRTRETLIVMVGHQQGRILLSAGGALTRVDDRSDPVGDRIDGAWPEPEIQRAIDREVAEHLEHVAGAVNRASRAPRRPIVLVGVDEIRGEFMRYLDQQARDLVAGWTSVDPHATPNDVARAARDVFAIWWAGRERELVELWRAAAARHSGHGAAGFEEVTEAAADGAVELLLYQDVPETQRRPGWECPECGRPAAAPGVCPLHGLRLVRQDHALAAILRETLRYGGKALAMGDHERLTAAQGVGAMLRYPAA